MDLSCMGEVSAQFGTRISAYGASCVRAVRHRSARGERRAILLYALTTPTGGKGVMPLTETEMETFGYDSAMERMEK